MEQFNIEWKDIASVKPYARNAKKHDETQIANVAESIKQFGWQQPIVCDADGIIIIGHCRLLAAKKLGLKKVPVKTVDNLSEEQVKKLRALDNKLNESDWDFDLLAEDIGELDFSGFDIEWGLPADVEETEIVEDEAPEVDEESEPICKLGDIWQLGNHRLMCGDSTDKATVERLMDGKKADMVFTDPPYDIGSPGGGIIGKSNSMKQIKENGVDTFDPLKLFLYAKTNVFFHNKPLIKKYIELSEREKQPYDLAIYKKENCVPNYNSHLMTDIEYIAIIGELDPKKGYDKELYSKVYIGKKDVDNELSYSKPIELCAKFIKLYSENNEIVLDLFGGSGSTLIACEQLNRVCYMCELDPKYCTVILKRYIAIKGSADDVFLIKDGNKIPFNEIDK